MTSRRPLSQGLTAINDECLRSVKVSPFGIEEATVFLRSLLPHTIDARTFEAELAASMIIARQLRYLPLILRQLGTMIGRRSLLKDGPISALLERHVGAELFSQPCSYRIYGYLSSASDALANVITFLDPYQIDDAVLLSAQRCGDFPLKTYPMTDHDYFDAKDELLSHALLLQAGTDSVECHRVTHRSLRNRLDPTQFRQGFHCASQLLEGRWPSKRKMKNAVLGNWPEFDSLHGHVHELSTIYLEYARRSHDIDSSYMYLENDAYLNFLLLSTWWVPAESQTR